MALIGSSYWLLLASGLITGYAPLYHGLIQIELFCSAFGLGFLLTALPKFLRTRHATSVELSSFAFVYLVLSAAILAGWLFIGQWCFAAMIALLIRFAVTRFRERKTDPPNSFVLVACGLLAGFSGALLLNYPLTAFPMLGQKLLEQGMFLSLTLGVGSFLGPRLMGIVDTENALVNLAAKNRSLPPFHKSPVAVVVLIGIVIFGSFFIETGWSREWGIFLRAAASIFCLGWFRVLQLPRSRSVVACFAAIALWCVALGILAAALFPAYEVALLHLTYIGGFGLLILTIGAKVITSHGGVRGFWDQRRYSAIFVGVLTLVSILVRIGAAFYPVQYLLLLGLAAFIFNVALITWGVGVLRYLGSKAAP